jgi:hypothetical protein
MIVAACTGSATAESSNATIATVVAHLIAPFISLFHFCVERKEARCVPVKEWEIIADNLHKAGWSLGWVSAFDLEGRTVWIVDAHRDDGRGFVVHAEEKLTAG